MWLSYCSPLWLWQCLKRKKPTLKGDGPSNRRDYFKLLEKPLGSGFCPFTGNVNRTVSGISSVLNLCGCFGHLSFCGNLTDCPTLNSHLYYHCYWFTFCLYNVLSVRFLLMATSSETIRVHFPQRRTSNFKAALHPINPSCSSSRRRGWGAYYSLVFGRLLH